MAAVGPAPLLHRGGDVWLEPPALCGAPGVGGQAGSRHSKWGLPTTAAVPPNTVEQVVPNRSPVSGLTGGRFPKDRSYP